MNQLFIRPVCSNEVMLLAEFLYEAIFQPVNTPKIARTVIQRPEIWAYIDEFGLRPDDVCHVAVINGLIVGAVWSRLGCSYGKVDDVTPELALSVYPEYRDKGIGTRLLSSHLECLREKGYAQVSLSVDKTNYAVKMYRKLGFEIIDERLHDYLMIKRLK